MEGKTLCILISKGVIRPTLNRTFHYECKFVHYDHLNTKNIVLKNKCPLVT